MRIADTRHSADAVLLLREVERLRVLEVKATQLARRVAQGAAALKRKKPGRTLMDAARRF